MRDVVVFCGSTLDRHTAAGILPATYRPPASRDDIAMAVLISRPRVIGLIDGVFETVPAVSHKEILWAMSEGVHVFGSAGVGALRASELEAFGMEGVGKVFESLKNGIYEDDDEIAVAHAREHAKPLSIPEAMVNIRATLLRASEEGIIDTGLHAKLTRHAKEMFYKDRTYDAVLERARSRGISKATVARLREWLKTGRVDQMRLDAIEMLRTIRDRMAQELPQKNVAFRLEPARIWVERLEKCRANLSETRQHPTPR